MNFYVMVKQDRILPIYSIDSIQVQLKNRLESFL